MSKIFISVPAQRSGCYLLKLKRKVVYVGSSGDVLARLSGHSEKKFDAVEIIWCDHGTAVIWEKKLIAEHRPPLNTALVPPAVSAKKFLRYYRGVPKPVKRGKYIWDMAATGAKLKRYRERCGIPLAILSQASGLNHFSLWRLEKGRVRQPYLWNSIEKAFEQIARDVNNFAKESQ